MQTAAQTKAQLEKAVENPEQTQEPTVVHLTLKFEGVKFKPVELYEAIDAKYATVRNEKDSSNRGEYIWRISS